MSKKLGTYLVTFKNGDKVIFGNNYKTWDQHALEYTYENFKNPKNGWRYDDVAGVVIKVEFSRTPFQDDGGLKWCNYIYYQEVVDDVYATKESNGLKPKMIVVDNIKFDESPVDLAKLIRRLKEY